MFFLLQTYQSLFLHITGSNRFTTGSQTATVQLLTLRISGLYSEVNALEFFDFFLVAESLKS